MPEATTIVNDDTLPPERVTPDYSRIADKLSIPAEPDAPPPDNTPPATTVAHPVEEKTEKPADIPAAELVKASNAEQAAKRVAAKNAMQELAVANSRIAELEAIAAKQAEMEAAMTETKTLAEMRAAELEMLKSRYTNETSVLSPELIAENPTVRAAEEEFSKTVEEFFPLRINNRAADEPDQFFDRNTLTARSTGIISDMVSRWEAEHYQSTASPAARAEVQHVLLSNIAAELGVPRANFQETYIGDSAFKVLPPTHPVYQHLSNMIKPLVDKRRARDMAQQAVRDNVDESLKPILNTRAENTRRMFTNVGLGITGEPLKEMLAKNPDNFVVQAMSMLENQPELLKELKDTMDLEVAVNSHLRPQLDLAEKDIGERNKKANAFMTRLGQRAVFAPLAPVLAKLARTQAGKIAEQEAKIKSMQAELDKVLGQAEPGAASGAPPEPKATAIDPRYAKVAQMLGIAS